MQLARQLAQGGGRSLAAALVGGSAPAAAAAGGALRSTAAAVAVAGFHAARQLLASLQVKIPALGESISDGTVATVLKQAGDRVEEDEPILQVGADGGRWAVERSIPPSQTTSLCVLLFRWPATLDALLTYLFCRLRQ